MSQNHQIIFYSALVSGIVLSRIPVIGKFLRVSNTLVHESGHALLALFTSGKVLKIKLSFDTSGEALTQTKFWIGRFITSLGGYFSASFFGFLSFLLIKQQKEAYILIGLISLAIINLVFWVRNSFGIFWLISLLAISGGLFYLENREATQFFAVLFTTIISLEAVTSAWTIMILSYSNAGNSGDAKNLKIQTSIPAFIWGTLFFTQSLYFLYKTIKLFLNLPF